MSDDTLDPTLRGLPPLGARHLVVAAPGWPRALAPTGTVTEVVPEGLIAMAPAAWDAVGLLGVLARVHDPSALLDAAVDRLAAGGWLVLAEATVPDAEALHGRGTPWPPFRRWQLGSVVQGYGLQSLGFGPIDLADGTALMRAWGQRP
jgi:hypothetical protein